MARKRKGDKVDGWLVIDKPTGITSAHVVAKVKRITNAQKVGHAGTLDPLATGILPIGLGEATKTMPYITDSTKQYDFTVRWGIATDSDDCDGTITHSGGICPKKADILSILDDFVGDVAQKPPAYSAIKVDGQRAYTLARAGKTPEMKERIVKIQSLTLKSHDQETQESMFSVACGKGTYVRSIARDMATKLATYGHITVLRRTQVGPFHLNHAILLEKLENFGHSARAAELVLPIATALDDIPALAVTEAEAALLKQGQSIKLQTAKQGEALATCDTVPVAMVMVDENCIKPLRVFNM